jgi:hypothetical protein
VIIALAGDVSYSSFLRCRSAVEEEKANTALKKHQAQMKARRAEDQKEEARLMDELKKYRPHIGGLDSEAANSSYLKERAARRKGL